MRMLGIIASREVADCIRNRWIVAAILCLGSLAFLLALLGDLAVGETRVSPLLLLIANLSSLTVYFVPLIGLMLSYDSLVGEAERGTLGLLPTYPISRWQVVVGKFVGHVLVLMVSIAVG